MPYEVKSMPIYEMSQRNIADEKLLLQYGKFKICKYIMITSSNG